MRAYEHIAQRRAHVPVRQLCHVLSVAPSAYYGWHRQQHLPAAEPAWQVVIRQLFVRYGRRHGTRRLRAEVHAESHQVGRGRIRRVLAQHGLRTQQPRAFLAPPTRTRTRAAPNRLLGKPGPTALNRVWVGDITYLPRQGGGWLYLATWLDRCSRKIVG